MIGWAQNPLNPSNHKHGRPLQGMDCLRPNADVIAVFELGNGDLGIYAVSILVASQVPSDVQNNL
jgi:hypothetical protein